MRPCRYTDGHDALRPVNDSAELPIGNTETIDSGRAKLHSSWRREFMYQGNESYYSLKNKLTYTAKGRLCGRYKDPPS